MIVGDKEFNRISIERGARSTVMASPSILVVFGHFRQFHGRSFSGATNLTFFRRRLLAHPANRRAPVEKPESFPADRAMCHRSVTHVQCSLSVFPFASSSESGFSTLAF